jgi:broad-specificity NMP kinase
VSAGGEARPVPVLVLTGPIGVGKSTVADEVSDLLRETGEPHVEIDMDSLSWCYPRPDGDPHAVGLRFRNLAAIWPNFVAAGARRAVISAVVEARTDLERYPEAIPGAELTVVRLQASPATLEERIRRRMPGAGVQWHLDRAPVLAEVMERAAIEDHLVETDGRGLREIAEEVLDRVGWRRP